MEKLDLPYILSRDRVQPLHVASFLVLESRKGRWTMHGTIWECQS